MIHRMLRYCCMALAMCLGSVAFAADPIVHHSFTIAGDQGRDQAAFAAREVQMIAAGGRQGSSPTAGLLKDAHGFLQITADEVAEGVTGSTVLLTA